jgi:hypothetical protein
MKKNLYTFLGCLLISFASFSQSQPVPFNLAQGNFLFSEWDSLSAPATYPASLIFHTINVQPATMADSGKADWTCAYNLNAGPRFKGKGVNGIGMINTGNTQIGACASDTSTPLFVGELVLALNTSGRTNIQLSWIGRMISSFNYVPSPGSNPVNRFFGLVCQYRVGASGPFLTFSNDSIFVCNLNDSTYHPQGFADTLGLTSLPVICEDQPIVQLRWLYFQTNSGLGPRPELAVDDISITSDIATTYQEISAVKSLIISPNPSEIGRFNFSRYINYRVINLQGMEVKGLQKNNQADLSDLPNGIYLIQSSEGNFHKVVKK